MYRRVQSRNGSVKTPVLRKRNFQELFAVILASMSKMAYNATLEVEHKNECHAYRVANKIHSRAPNAYEHY